MAEISYPFNADNADGGRAIVSQTQWQDMAHLWGGDRIDYTLANTSYASSDLPFSSQVIGRSVEIKPGKAWVGGFYYQLTTPQSVTIAANPDTKARKDLIVIQTDMSKSATKLAVIKGTAASTPVPPQPRRIAGGLWEMVLYEVDVAALDASVTVGSRMSFNMPAPVTSPWNTKDSAKFLPHGSMIYDLDVNTNDCQYEAFNGRDGYAITRHMGKSLAYTPQLVNMSGTFESVAEGNWRIIGPNTVWFSVNFRNSGYSAYSAATGATAIGITLPRPALGRTGQILPGYLYNGVTIGTPTDVPTSNQSVTGLIKRGGPTATLLLYTPFEVTDNPGLRGLTSFPGKGELILSGTYEADLL